MRSCTIDSHENGIQLINYLVRKLPNAGRSFLYKMLRKKNIVLNKKKAEGNEILKTGDLIEIYFAEETYIKFAGSLETRANDCYINNPDKKNLDELSSDYRRSNISAKKSNVSIIYEDEDILIADKPAGMLTQKARSEDYSLNDYLIDYLNISHDSAFKPSVCNRLDRNTSGLVMCSKSVHGARLLSEMLKDRSLEKYYLTVVSGIVDKSIDAHGYLIKNEKTNKVVVKKEKEPESEYIHTAFKVLKTDYERKITLLEVKLYTGKSHQIRAHLASMNYPIIGDPKYGNSKVNTEYKKLFKINSQLLHAYRVVFPMNDSCYGGKSFEAEIPKVYDSLFMKKRAE